MSEVNAARINNLQSRIELLLGTGAGQFGYGQTVNSSQVSALNGLIQASDLNQIYADILKARIHQVGPGNIQLAELVANLNIIAEETSFFVNDQGVQSADPNGNLKGILDFERMMNTLETDKFLMDPSQATLAPAITSVRTSTWNGTREHEFIVTFTSENHRRHFFNSGGQIRFSASNTNAVTPKGLDWAELTNDVGTVIFNYNSTRSTGDGSIVMLGNYDLTGSYQTIYEKIGSGTFSAIYAGNVYTIRARVDTVNRLFFSVLFQDLVTGTTIDNDVDGRLESRVQQFYANNPDGVAVPTPSFFNQKTL